MSFSLGINRQTPIQELPNDFQIPTSCWRNTTYNKYIQVYLQNVTTIQYLFI